MRTQAIVLAALFAAVEETQAIHLREPHQVEELDDSLAELHIEEGAKLAAQREQEFLENEVLNLGLPQKEEVDIFDSEKLLQVDEASEAQYKPKNCMSGIKRLDGSSNSLNAYQKARKSGQKWQDPQFGADSTSLRWDMFGFGIDSAYGTPPMDLLWKRPAEFGAGYGKDPKLFGNLGKPVPQGISQGTLGDCWFLAGVASVAENADRIYNVMHDRSYNENGIFRFKFWGKNKWHWINVDDRLPAKKYKYSNADIYYFRPWATQRSQQHAWWMPILEKAYAKFNQNYDRLSGGQGVEGLRAMTGMPAVQLWHKEHGKEMAQYHEFWAKQDYPMTAGCCKAGEDTWGIISGHAYSVLDVKSIEFKGEKVRLIQMRNPWSKEKYHGMWRDDDPNWTPARKRAVGGLTKADDGKFWMPYWKFRTLFQSTSVAFYQDWKHRTDEITIERGSMMYRINNPVAQQVYISGDMWSKRNEPRGCSVKNDVVLYLTDSNGKAVGPKYSFVGGVGIGTVGHYTKAIPAGSYALRIVNQGSGKPQVSLNIYARHQLPSFKKDWKMDGCKTEWVATGAFGAGEKYAGKISSPQECVTLAHKKCPNHDMASVDWRCHQKGQCSQCWCQHSNGKNPENFYQKGQGWLSCKI